MPGLRSNSPTRYADKSAEPPQSVRVPLSATKKDERLKQSLVSNEVRWVWQLSKPVTLPSWIFWLHTLVWTDVRPKALGTEMSMIGLRKFKSGYYGRISTILSSRTISTDTPLGLFSTPPHPFFKRITSVIPISHCAPHTHKGLINCCAWKFFRKIFDILRPTYIMYSLIWAGKRNVQVV